MQNEIILAQITVNSDPVLHVEPLQHYAAALARSVRLAEDKTLHLSILIEEVIQNICEKAYQGRKNEQITVTFSTLPGDLIVRMEYKGLPFGYVWGENGTHQTLSFKVISSLSSNYRMVYRGKEGTLVELHMSLPTDLEENAAAQTVATDKPADDIEQVILRHVNEDELTKLVQAFYNVFGYTYASEGIYYPEVIKERMREGLYKGYVALNALNQVVAHVGSLRNKPNDTICESGQAFVLPQYSHHGIFHKLKQMLLDDARKAGMKGVKSYAVATHEHLQKANLDLGCKETGLMLGYVPESFTTSFSEAQKNRQSVMLFFTPFDSKEEQSVYVPEKHEAVISNIYGRLGLRRKFCRPFDFDRETVLRGENDIEVEVKTEWQQLRMRIWHAGDGFAEHLRTMQREAAQSGVKVIYTATPLTSPITPLLVEALEDEGFIFAGISPCALEGRDAINMQYLIDKDIPADSITTASPEGQKIKEYVLSQL